MADLWATDDPAAWARALDTYPAVIAAQGVPRLVELDTWYRGDLPGLIAGRGPAAVTLDELVRVTEWKMKRCVWRARNLALVRGNDPAEVARLSAAACALIPDPRKPVARLAELAGVGPATASAVLAAIRPDLYPFFDEIVAVQIHDLGAVAFTLAYYGRYAERLRVRAADLAASAPGAKWTAHAVGQALFAAAGGKAGPQAVP